MTTLPTPWRKPSSLNGGHGPELRLCGDGHVEIRHSREHAGPDGQEWFAAFSRAEFAAFLRAAREGEYDSLASCPECGGTGEIEVGHHTCGTGPDGHYGHHEPGCGLEPCPAGCEYVPPAQRRSVPQAAANLVAGILAERIGQALDAGKPIECKPLAIEALEAAAPFIRAPAELAAGKAVMQREERIAALEAALKRFEHSAEAVVEAATRRGIDKGVAAANERAAELERLADDMLSAFSDREPFSSDGGPPMIRSRSVGASRHARWVVIRHSGEAALAAADELSQLGQELQGGEPG